MNTQLLHHMDELHSRISDGIHVRLLWSNAFTVMVAEGERALDVFHHPYAYAPPRGVA